MELSTLTISQSGEYPVYEKNIIISSSVMVRSDYYSGSVSQTASINIRSDYYSGSIFQTSSIKICNDYYSSSILIPGTITGSKMLTTDWCGTIVTRDPYSGSYGCTHSIIDVHRYKCGYYRKIFYYDVTNVDDPRLREWHMYVSRSNKQHSSSSLTPHHYQYEECSNINKSRFEGSKLSGRGINIDSESTIDGGPVIIIKESNPNALFTSRNGGEGNIKLE